MSFSFNFQLDDPPPLPGEATSSGKFRSSPPGPAVPTASEKGFAFNFQVDSPGAKDAPAEKAAAAGGIEASSASTPSPPPRARVLSLGNTEVVDLRIPSEEVAVPVHARGDSEDGAGSPRWVKFTAVDPERQALPEEFVAKLDLASGPTDLVKGVYEGGLKVWEGSLDLVAHLDRNRNRLLQPKATGYGGLGGGGKKGRGAGKKKGRTAAASSERLRCLELGCGHGLPGMYALKSVPRRWRVWFSDFNEEVLAFVTFPNVLMNVDDPSRRAAATFVAGDWNSLGRAVEAQLEQEARQKAEGGIRGGQGGGQEADVGGEVGEPSSMGVSPPAQGESGDESSEAPEEVSELGEAKGEASETESGDEKGLFDLILASEVCYTEASCQEVASLIAKLLSWGGASKAGPSKAGPSKAGPSKAGPRSERGVAVVATKRFYFGTGGGSACFARACEAFGLHVEVAESIDDGRSNIREILEVKRKD